MTRTTIFAVIGSLMLIGAGCAAPTAQKAPAANPQAAADKSDLSVCGNFPRTTGDGGPTSRYSVCREADSGNCYLKTVYSSQIPGCDPQFELNPYGDEKCFEYLTDVYADGKKTVAGAKEYRPSDACALTTQEYFKSQTQ